MIDGTRHERAALVFVAYVIGFITAFTAYGLFRDETQLVYTTVPNYAVSYNQQTSGFSFNAGFESDGLYAITDVYRRIVSANKNALSASALASIPEGPGYHYQIVDAETSPNGKFMYYCEQLDADKDVCNPYVYNLETDSVYPVTLGGQSLVYQVTNHNSQWHEGSVLVVNEAMSADSTMPWKLERWLP